MRFEVLGPLRVTSGDVELRLGEPQQQRLLALLLASSERPMSTDRLIEELWRDDPPPSARHLVQVYVARLRATFRAEDDRELIVRAGDSYRLTVVPGESDALDLELAVEEARRLHQQDPAAAAERLRAATERWRGAPFAWLADESPTLQAEAHRLEELHLRAVEDLSATELELGRHRQLLARLEQLVAEHPYHERFWELWMLALYRCGRQVDALQAYHDLRRRLVDDLGIEPGPEVRTLERRILLHDPELLWEPPSPPSNLPTQVSSFIGRRQELAELATLLGESRLITLIGPGGIGKTRLAIEAGRDVMLRFPDGVWWVDLAPLRDPELVPAALAETLGVAPQPNTPLADSIVRALLRRSALVLVDNCEHLVDGVADLVTRVLGGTRQVRVLATSRSPLRVSGEVLWAVPPLGLPSTPAADVLAVDASDAVRLFVDRGHAVDPALRLDAGNVTAVVDVARRLDGLPLAIEMAAAQARVLSPPQIADALSDRFALLARTAHGSRHDTLEAAFDWSYELLDPEHRRAFDRISVFAGPFDLDAAEAVSGVGRTGTLDAITALVDASMLMTVHPAGDKVAYRLLDTMREYGMRRLRAGSEEAVAREAHADHFIGLVEAAGDAVGTRRFATWAVRLRSVYPDVRQALGWMLDHQRRSRVLGAARTLFHLWFRTGDGQEAGLWGRRMLAGADDESAGLRAAGHHLLSFSSNIAGDAQVALTESDLAVRLFRDAGDRVGLATALFGRGNVALLVGDLDGAAGFAHEALAVCDEPHDPWNRAGALAVLGMVHFVRGSLDEARDCSEQASVLYRELGDIAGQVVMCPASGIARRQGDLRAAETLAHQAAVVATGTAWEGAALVGVAEVALARGEVDGAELIARRAMTSALDAGVEIWFRQALHALAQVHARRGDAERAALLLGASRRNAFALVLDPVADELIDERCRAILGSRRFEQTVERGRGLDHERLLDLVTAGVAAGA